MVSVYLPSDALLQHLPSYLGFSYLGRGVSLHGCSRKAQPLLLTLDRGISPHHRPSWPSVWDSSSRPSCARAARAPWTWSWSSRLPPLTSGLEEWGCSSRPLPLASGLGCGSSPPGRCPWPRTRGNSSSRSPWPWTRGSSSCRHPWPRTLGISSGPPALTSDAR